MKRDVQDASWAFGPSVAGQQFVEVLRLLSADCLAVLEGTDESGAATVGVS